MQITPDVEAEDCYVPEQEKDATLLNVYVLDMFNFHQGRLQLQVNSQDALSICIRHASLEVCNHYSHGPHDRQAPLYRPQPGVQ